MKRSEMMDLIEEKFLDTTPGEFVNTEHALVVAASALKYLSEQCSTEEEEDAADKSS